MNAALQDIINTITVSSSFVGEDIDKSGNRYTFQNYSITVQLLPSWVEKIKEEFKSFSITHLFLDYYIIGFGKSNLV